MTTDELRGLFFRTDAGETVRVHDCICWRHLEGRPCRTAGDRQVANTTDVVLIPVVPSGYGSIKRARKNASGGSATKDLLGGPDSNNGNHASAVHRDALLSACASAQAALEAAGLRAAIDACPKQTPGAKYNAWENRGVPLRVEIGVREIAAGTFSLAVHPCLPHLLPVAAQAAAPAAGAEGSAPSPHGVTDGDDNGCEPAAPAGTDTDTAQRTCADGADGRTHSGEEGRGPAGASTVARKTSLKLKLPGLGLQELVAACGAVCAAVREGVRPGAPAGPAAAAASQSGPQWCRKLHLWPDQVAAWGDTSAAVAALLAALAASPAGAGAAAGAAPDNGEGGEGVGHSEGPQRPCVPHLRYLLQLGRACHCGRGHLSLQQLQQEVERRFREGTGQQVTAWGPLPPHPSPPQPLPQPHPPPAHGNGRAQRPLHNPQQPGSGQTSQRQPQRRSAAGGAEDEGLNGDDDEDGGEDAGGGSRLHGLDGGSEAGSELAEGEGPGGGRVVLLVGNIPSAVKAAVVQAELAAAFEPFGCLGVAVSRTRSGGSHGWARVTLVGAGVDAAAAEAVRQLDGTLKLGGVPLTVSHSCGRLDTIFPYLPYVVRAAMRVDSTAAFSATDQATADKTTHLLAALAERLVMAVPEGPTGPRTQTPARVQAEGELPSRGIQTAQREGASAVQEPALTPAGPGAAGAEADAAPPPALLPLSITDGTACCGGNTLSFARRFRRVTAVELDEDRAADLSHNAALVSAWVAFRHSKQKQQQRQQQDDQDAASPLYDDAPIGLLDVVCGDYTALKPGLSQDIVFLDPPWGGPQYLTTPAPQAQGRASAAGGGGSDGRGGLEYGDTAFMLGQEPLSYIVAELLASGAAGMVALKLPSRADMELRAMQARVRQLVAARTARKRGGSNGGGGCAPDGAGSQGQPRDARCGCGPRLLGAEVTLGRSALVLFLLLPYRAGGCGTAAPEPSGFRSGCGGLQGGQQDARRGAVGPAAVPSGVGGGGGGSGGCEVVKAQVDEGAEAEKHDRQAGSEPELQPGGESSSDGDDDDSEEEEEEEEGVNCCGGAGRGARAAGRRAGGKGGAHGCPACGRLGPAFRAALRECCGALALQYRVVCD